MASSWLPSRSRTSRRRRERSGSPNRPAAPAATVCSRPSLGRGPREPQPARALWRRSARVLHLCLTGLRAGKGRTVNTLQRAQPRQDRLRPAHPRHVFRPWQQGAPCPGRRCAHVARARSGPRNDDEDHDGDGSAERCSDDDTGAGTDGVAEGEQAGRKAYAARGIDYADNVSSAACSSGPLLATATGKAGRVQPHSRIAPRVSQGWLCAHPTGRLGLSRNSGQAPARVADPVLRKGFTLAGFRVQGGCTGSMERWGAIRVVA